MLRKLLIPALVAGLLLPAAATARAAEGAPTTFIGASTPDNARVQGKPHYQLDGADPFDGAFWCYLDGKPIGGCDDWDQDFAGVDVSQGTHTFSARTVHRSLPQGPLASRTFTLDSVGPDVSFTSPYWTNDTTPHLTFDAPADGGAPYTAQCKLDGAPITCAWGSYQVTSPLAQGGHTLQVQARDGLGNLHTRPELWLAFEFNVDTTAPVIKNVGFSAAAKQVKFEIEGAESFDCSLDGVPLPACQSPYDVSALAPGDHTLKLHAVDSAGNEATQRVSFDLPAPPAPVTPRDSTSPSPQPIASPGPAPVATPAPVVASRASTTATTTAAKKTTCAAAKKPAKKAKGKRKAKASACKTATKKKAAKKRHGSKKRR